MTMFVQYFAELLSPPVLIMAIRAHLYLSFGGGFAISLLLWRICKFTVLPFLYPDDPKELPYWIPGEPLLLLIPESQFC